MLLDAQPYFTPPFQHEGLITIAGDDATFVRAAEDREVREDRLVRRLHLFERELVRRLPAAKKL
jgi:hypothetical protein